MTGCPPALMKERGGAFPESVRRGELGQWTQICCQWTLIMQLWKTPAPGEVAVPGGPVTLWEAQAGAAPNLMGRTHEGEVGGGLSPWEGPLGEAGEDCEESFFLRRKEQQEPPACELTLNPIPCPPVPLGGRRERNREQKDLGPGRRKGWRMGSPLLLLMHDLCTRTQAGLRDTSCQATQVVRSWTAFLQLFTAFPGFESVTKIFHPFTGLGTGFAENPFSLLLLPTAVMRGGVDTWNLLLRFSTEQGRQHWDAKFASHRAAAGWFTA
ncbi:uncharacterized protein LOC127385111 [Apus apus]|uniref:uncharacterized protein LOC127385111 n=1 Tax=Apus apus TaxID=8895 RepID=UPI0021F8C65F|nr:uncharacterized protein LOC127385111 [Apus apus]